MSKLPSMPFFPSDFFADTAHISGDAAATYLVLLGHAWLRGGKLPADDRVLSRLARVSWQKWGAIKDEVLSFWESTDDGFYTQKRLLQTMKWVGEKIEAFSQNGIKGNEKRWNKNRNDFSKTSSISRSPSDHNQNHIQLKKSFLNSAASLASPLECGSLRGVNGSEWKPLAAGLATLASELRAASPTKPTPPAEPRKEINVPKTPIAKLSPEAAKIMKPKPKEPTDAPV